jgi:hypothetical protein
VFGGFAAVLLFAAVFWVSSNDESGLARANGEAITRDIAMTVNQIEGIGVSPVEARRSALMFYANTKLPRLLVPQRPATGDREQSP